MVQKIKIPTVLQKILSDCPRENTAPVNSGLVYRSTGLIDIVCANEFTIISKRHNASASSVSIETSSRMASIRPAK